MKHNDIKSTLSEKELLQQLELFDSIIGAIPQTLILLNRDKLVIEVRNAKTLKIKKHSLENIIGKTLGSYIQDTNSPFSSAALILNKYVDSVFASGEPVQFNYDSFGQYFRVCISKIINEFVLVQVRDVTDAILEVERKNKELSLALTAGGLTSWVYNLKSGIVTSSHNNDIIGEYISYDDIVSRVIPEDRPLLSDMFDKILANKGVIGTTNVRIHDIRNNIRVSEVHTIPYEYDENGDVCVVIGSQKDVTSEYDNYKKLTVSEQKSKDTTQLLFAILDSMPTPLFIKDVNDNYRYVISNRLFCEITGKAESDIVGHRDHDIFPKDFADRYHKDDLSVDEHHNLVIDEETIDDDGNITVWHTTKSLFVTETGRRLLIGVALDLTEKAQTLEKMEIAKRRAEQSDSLKTSFLANMSHEIRTPLNAIVGFSKLVNLAETDEERSTYLKIIDSNTELLLRLINDVLDLSKIEAGYVDRDDEEFCLSELFMELEVAFMLRISEGIEFVCDVPNQCLVKLDRAKISQVLSNFITNAIKFTKKGHIKIGYNIENDGVRMYVEDTGIGMKEDEVARVFDRFEKFHKFEQGTGLGTAICKAIVDVYNGEIGAESVFEQGSTFWAWIPCKVITLNNAEIKMEEGIKETTMREDSTVKILVAEDNDSNYLLMKTILKQFNLTRAYNGEEAVGKLKEFDYDLVLMDIRMPIMDGLEATRAIREFNKTIPIIAVTANAFDSDRDDAIKAGCNAHLGKPINREMIMNIISTYCF